VRIVAHDRAGLERPLRYCARPPFALHRLRPESSRVPLRSPDARLIHELPRPAQDGRTAIRVSPLELLDRLARLIPPPRVHRHRYHGVFALNARWRKNAACYGRDTADESGFSSEPDPDLPATDAACAHAHHVEPHPLAMGHRQRFGHGARPLRPEPPWRRRHLERLTYAAPELSRRLRDDRPSAHPLDAPAHPFAPVLFKARPDARQRRQSRLTAPSPPKHVEPHPERPRLDFLLWGRPSRRTSTTRCPMSF